MNHKTNHIEATKARAVISDTNALTCKGENVLQNIGGHFVIINLNLKIQFPSRFESRTGAWYARSLNYDWSIINIKRLISVCVQFFGHGKAFVIDKVWRYKDACTYQVLVSLAAFASHLEVYGGFLDRAVKVFCGLVDTSLRIGVKVISPFLRPIWATSRFLTTLPHRIEIRHWITMLNQWSGSYNSYTNGIHFLSFLEQNPARLCFAGFCSGNGRFTQTSGVLLANKKRLNFLNTGIIMQVDNLVYRVN